MHSHELIDTRSATLERVSSELIELRFKPDVKLDVEGVSEIANAKKVLCSGKRTDVLAILPPEMDFELNVLAFELPQKNGGCGEDHRMAFATQSTFNERITSIYLRYHPRPYPTAVFVSEEDARTWLATELPVPSAS